MSYQYSGDNNWMDHLEAVSPAFVIFANETPAYNCAVAYDTEIYQTIGTSFEFGGLTNSDATKTALMQAYLEFFGIIQPLTADFTADNTTIAVGGSIQFTSTSTGDPDTFLWTFEGGNPNTSTEENPLVTYNTPGTYDVSLTITSGSANATELKKDYITVTAPLLTQEINIPAGWSGLSGYLIPENADLDILLQQITGEMIILQSLDGVYYPGAGINTIGQWDNHKGYQIKTTNDITLTITGWEDNSHEVNLQTGWNLLPVLSECNVPVAELLNATGGSIVIVKEIAGSGIYWPSMNIATLDWLMPGEAYWVRTTSDVTVTFPSCK
jgi:PKD repeat protein